MLTIQNTIGDVYRTPVGEDIINKLLLQMGISKRIMKNPLIMHLRLKTLLHLAGDRVDPEMIEAILHLAGSDEGVEECSGQSDTIRHAWWKEAVFYQIYPRSFCDQNGDGIGDLQGIISKLDYLKELGVGAIWLSPIYDSPNDDNGYDIRDYHKIMAEFGTMEDFTLLLQEVHGRGMRLIMDLVVNHTSDEHALFQAALSAEDAPERDAYFFVRDEEGKIPPTNWVSFFSGSAWTYYPQVRSWALHLFSKKQMDLNWDNPSVRDKVVSMVNWWLDLGVDGFRMDVINYISKERTADGGLPEGNRAIGEMMTFTGIEHYYYGPHLHEYLRQLHREAFAPHDAFSVGETPGLGMRMAQLVTSQDRGELDMIFSFDHLESPGHVRFDDYQYDLNYYRDYITDWMEHYGDQCWMSLFYNNHDNPRMCSKITKDPQYVRRVQILLAVMQMTLKGTPFLFQGDEMGLENYEFASMEQITDIESQNLYQELLSKGKSHKDAFATILAGTREHCRVMLPWNTRQSAAPGRPTYLPQELHAEIHTAYRTLIALRKSHEALIYGSFRLLCRSKDRFIYERRDERECFIIECNLGTRRRCAKIRMPEEFLCFRTQAGPAVKLVQSTQAGPAAATMTQNKKPESIATLEAYEARIWRRDLR
ncbi:MAG: alpha-glucosidase [Lachnospiraceae bacterium]|nr:alpha-glucosidase [Lachnospiraceae bacterium]